MNVQLGFVRHSALPEELGNTRTGGLPSRPRPGGYCFSKSIPLKNHLDFEGIVFDKFFGFKIMVHISMSIKVQYGK